MKQYLVAKGISEAKLVELGIFDYLISPYEPLRIAERMIGRTLPIVIAEISLQVKHRMCTICQKGSLSTCMGEL
jgi:hypothetical protein